MSLNDHPEVTRIFGGIKVQTVSLRYRRMRKIASRGTTRGELLISNH
jgi:hypothetical protein